VAADRLQRAIMAVFRQGATLTCDLGGTATTRQFTSAVVRHLDTV
jgi:isocitrate/isopropylmalate dehydrogenase